MCPVGILFIIFPLNLINPRSVMNLWKFLLNTSLLISAGLVGGWQGLLTATQGVWLCRAVLSEPGSWGWVGLGEWSWRPTSSWESQERPVGLLPTWV